MHLDLAGRKCGSHRQGCGGHSFRTLEKHQHQRLLTFIMKTMRARGGLTPEPDELTESADGTIGRLTLLNTATCTGSGGGTYLESEDWDGNENWRYRGPGGGGWHDLVVLLSAAGSASVLP